MSKRTLRMWIYLALVIIALLIIVLGAHIGGSENIGEPTQKRDINFYLIYSTPNELKLATVTYTVGDKSTEQLAKEALSYLISPPCKTDILIPPLPKDTKILDVKITGSLAIVNFSSDILKNPGFGAEGEMLALCSIANTMEQFGVKKVKIEVEGKTSGEVNGRTIEDFWGHVGLYENPITPCHP